MRYEAVLDFTVRTPRGDIAVKSGQVMEILEDKAKPLIGKIRCLGIKWDALSRIHLSTARGLVGVDFRVTSPAITQAEDALNKTWIDCLHGRAALTDFEAVNRLWADAVRAVNEKAKRVRLF